MPTYEYLCEKCGNFDFVQKITEDAMKTCPTCGSPVKRLISAAAFHLKGTGWYKTDYGSSSGRGGSSSSSGSASGEQGGSSSEKSAGGSEASSSAGDSSTEGAKPSSTTSGTSKE